jgi:K+-sensing histidine kinase KdpD
VALRSRDPGCLDSIFKFRFGQSQSDDSIATKFTIDSNRCYVDRTGFSNLLENAAKFSTPNSPITVKGYVAGDELMVEFQNDGPGFDPATIDSLFLPFSRGNSTQAQGFGLGLSICKIVMESHGGKIQALPQASGAVVKLSFRSGTPPAMEFHE